MLARKPTTAFRDWNFEERDLQVIWPSGVADTLSSFPQLDPNFSRRHCPLRYFLCPLPGRNVVVPLPLVATTILVVSIRIIGSSVASAARSGNGHRP